MRIIGLAGHKGTGKDTFGWWMGKNYKFNRIAFADPIRHILTDTNPVVGDTVRQPPTRYADAVAVYGYDEAKRQYPELRRLMQNLGESARHYLGKDVWVEAACRRIYAAPQARFVITDVRYQNEVDWIRSEGGVVIRLVRDGCGPDGHPSEDQAFDVDLVHYNREDVPVGEQVEFLMGGLLDSGES